MAFFTRLPLINWFNAEYTDAILYISFYYNKSTQIAPLYGALIEPLYNLFVFAPTYESVGRSISILAGSLCVIPTFLIGRYIFNEKVGIYATLLFIFSPVVLRWNIRVMTDSMFTLFFLSSIYFFIMFYYEAQKRWLLMGFFTAGLATLARYQGMALIFIVAFMWFREFRNRRYRAVLVSLLGLAPWLILCWWFLYRRFGQAYIFKGRTGNFLQYADQYTEMYAEMLKSYLLTLPYALTYPVFALFCYGAYKAWKFEKGRFLILLFAFLFFPWLIVHTIYLELVIRPFMPLFPFFMLFAAYAITLVRKDKVVLAVCLLISITMSAAVLYYQRDSFGDIKRAAEWVGYNARPGAIIYATDSGPYKSRLWSGRAQTKEYRPEAPLKTGDYLLLSSFYVSIADTTEILKKSFYINTLFETTSTIVPLLPDLTDPSEYTMTPEWNMVKFKKNEFKSVVLLLGKRRR